MSLEIFLRYCEYLLKKDYLKELLLQSDKGVHFLGIDDKKISYSLTKELSPSEVRDLEVLFKAPIRYVESSFNRYLYKYHHDISKPTNINYKGSGIYLR